MNLRQTAKGQSFKQIPGQFGFSFVRITQKRHKITPNGPENCFKHLNHKTCDNRRKPQAYLLSTNVSAIMLTLKTQMDENRDWLSLAADGVHIHLLSPLIRGCE